MAQHVPLSDEQLANLRQRGIPALVKLSDGGEVVVQSLDAYRRLIALLDELDIAQSARICAERWRALESGADPGVPAERFLAEIRGSLRRSA